MYRATLKTLWDCDADIYVIGYEGGVTVTLVWIFVFLTDISVLGLLKLFDLFYEVRSSKTSFPVLLGARGWR